MEQDVYHADSVAFIDKMHSASPRIDYMSSASDARVIATV
jgi:hypothetical protein